jgi:hypothetical protein
MASFSNKMMHQPSLVPLQALLWTNNFLVKGLAGEGQLIGPKDLDLAPMDFFWGYMKDIIHSASRRITGAITEVP